MPDVLQGHIDAALSTYAQRYRNLNFIADQVAPRVGVAQQSGKYWIFGRENLQGAAEDDIRAPGAPAAEIRRTLSSDSFFCPDHARKASIPQEEQANNQAEDVRQSYVDTLLDQIMLRHEARTAALYTTPAGLPAGHKVQLAVQRPVGLGRRGGAADRGRTGGPRRHHQSDRDGAEHPGAGP